MGEHLILKGCGARGARVYFSPEQDGHLVTFKASWVADNGSETAVFATRDEAVDFAKMRWGVEIQFDGSDA